MEDFLSKLNSEANYLKKSIVDKPLFSFKGSEISYGDANHNVLVMGGTGSGKTNMLRNGLEKLGSSGCPGVVLDVKGDYKEFLIDVAPERTVLVGATSDCFPINLIGGMSCEKFLSFITSETASMYKEKYWGSGGLRDIEFLFRYLLEESEPTLAKLYDMLLTPEDHIAEIMKVIRTREYLDKALIQSIHSVKQAPFGFFNRANANLADNPKLFEQYEWQTAGILSVLRDFSNHPDIKRNLSAIKQLDIEALVYEQNKIVILDMPITRFGSVAYSVSRLIRQRFVDAIFEQSPLLLAERGLGHNRYTFMLIDEYQQFINVSRGNNASGLYDDNLILDKTRQFGHINILATQGLSSLGAQVCQDGVNSLIQNCRTQVVYSSNDSSTINHVKHLSGNSEIAEKLLLPSSKGVAYVYTAHASSRDGGAISGLYRCPRNKWIPTLAEAPLEIQEPLALNPNFIKPRSAKIKRKDLVNKEVQYHSGKIILISTEELLIEKYKREWDSIRSRKSQKAWSRSQFSKSLEVESHLVDTESLKTELVSLLEDLSVSKGDVLCFLNTNEYYIYPTLSSFAPIQKYFSQLRNKGVVIYATDSFANRNKLSDYCHDITKTPTALAMMIKNNIEKSNKKIFGSISQKKPPLVLISSGEEAEKEFLSVYDAERFGRVASHQVLRLREETTPENIIEWLTCFNLTSKENICFLRDHSSDVPVSHFDNDSLVEWLNSKVSEGVGFYPGIHHEGVLSSLTENFCMSPGEVGFILNEQLEPLSINETVKCSLEKPVARTTKKYKATDDTKSG